MSHTIHIRFRATVRGFIAALRTARHQAELAARRMRQLERQAAKRPEQTALWSAYRAKTRRRNRRR